MKRSSSKRFPAFFSQGLKRRTLVAINALLLISFITFIAIIPGGNIFGLSLTGFTFAEFYDTQVMYTLNAIAGEETTFVIPINNNQDEAIEGLYAEIEVRDLDGNSIVTIDTEPIRVEPHSNTQITAPWNNDVLPGDYIAVIYLGSDAADASFTKTFNIDRRTISIESIQVNEFELGEVVNLDIIVHNHLDETIPDTTANLLIYDLEGNIVDNIKTQRTTLNASSLNRLSTKWNTEGLSVAPYNAQLVVAGGDYTDEEDLVFNIGQNTLSVGGVGFAINYAPTTNFDSIFVVAIILIGIILINVIIWFVYFRRRH